MILYEHEIRSIIALQQLLQRWPDILKQLWLRLRRGMNPVALHQLRIAGYALQEERHSGHLQLIVQLAKKQSEAFRIGGPQIRRHLHAQ